MPARVPRLIPLAAASALMLALSGCSGGGLALGDTANVGIAGAGGDYPFDVTVVSLEDAPAEVVDMYQGGDAIYFAEVEFTYTGSEERSQGFPNPAGNVLAELEDGSYLDTTFTGLTACSGQPDDYESWMDALAGGETVSVCVPLSADGDNDVSGVFVSNRSSNVNDGGATWKR